MASTCNWSCYGVFLAVLMLNWGSKKSEAFGTYGFDIHHRYSDPVKGILDLNDLPEKGTHDYYTVMAHRDRLIHGRRLAGTVNTTHLTFSAGNDTYRLNSLGFLHYANVTVGTPGLSFLVALDTGSDLFWLPCDCGNNCVRALRTRDGQIDLNMYSPNTSTTSTDVTCNDPICRSRRCSSLTSNCPYQAVYLSNNTSSTGTLVQDVLHLVTDDSDLNIVQAPIKFGCGRVQTGSFIDGAAPNGLFGLGMENISVPSILASEGLASNSFSMCFGVDGIGRIRFGDEGTTDQEQTPFNVDDLHPSYNISITQITVGDNVTNLDFTAIFDSGTSFTYLNDPAYSVITENFDSQALDPRHLSNNSLPFEYCYDMSQNETQVPVLNLTMRGGRRYPVTDPLVFVSLRGDAYLYCLGVLRSGDINIIGQNFMTGYHIVFDREKMVLGWKASDCYDGSGKQTLPPRTTNTTMAAPPLAIPEASPGNTNGSPLASPSRPTSGGGSNSSSLTYSISMILFSLFCILVNLSH
jgi:hypothetical protein